MNIESITKILNKVHEGVNYNNDAEGCEKGKRITLCAYFFLTKKCRTPGFKVREFLTFWLYP